MAEQSLKKWQKDIEARLKGLPQEASIAVAHRAAMRVAPMISLGAQRARPTIWGTITSGVAISDRSTDVIAAAAAYADAVVYADAAVARSAAAAAYAYADAAYFAAAVRSAAGAGAGAAALSAVESDLAVMTTKSVGMFTRKGLSPRALRGRPVWLAEAPKEIKAAQEDFRAMLVEDGLSVLADWYDSRIEGWPEIEPWERDWALQSSEFWEQDSHALGRALEEIRDKCLQSASEVSSGVDDQAAEEDASDASEGGAANGAEISRNIAGNAASVALTSVSLLAQVKAAREELRGRNDFEGTPGERDEVLQLLEQLQNTITRLLELLPTPQNDMTPPDARGVASWFRQFCRAYGALAHKASRPESVAKALFPASIILSCGALGALVGPPLWGVGGGLVIGKFVSGKLSVDQAIDELAKGQPEQDSDKEDSDRSQ